MGQSRRVEADVVAHIAEVTREGLRSRGISVHVHLCMDVCTSPRQRPTSASWGPFIAEDPVLLTMLRIAPSSDSDRQGGPHLTLANRTAPGPSHPRPGRQIEKLIAEIAPLRTFGGEEAS